MGARRVHSWIWVVLVIVVGVMAVAIASTLATPYGGGDYGMMGAGWDGWGLGMVVVPAVLVVVLLLAVSGGLNPTSDGVPAPATALEILEARYARGELSRDEYLRVRADLTRTEGERP